MSVCGLVLGLCVLYGYRDSCDSLVWDTTCLRHDTYTHESVTISMPTMHWQCVCDAGLHYVAYFFMCDVTHRFGT